MIRDFNLRFKLGIMAHNLDHPDAGFPKNAEFNLAFRDLGYFQGEISIVWVPN